MTFFLGHAAHVDRLSGQLVSGIDTVNAVEVLRVGSIDGEDALTSPGRAVMAPDQTLYVHFWKELNVRAIRPDGTLGKTFGGPGDGPGEMRVPAWHLSLVGSRLFTGSIERLTWFDLESDDLDTRIPVTPVRGVSGVISLFPWSVLSDGTVLLAPGPAGVGSPRGEEAYAPIARLVPGDPPRLDTIAQQVLRHERLVVRRPGSTGGGYSMFQNPWSTSDLVSPSPPLACVVLVDRARGGGAVTVRIIDADGVVTAERALHLGEGAALSSSEVSQVLDHLANTVATRGSRPPSRAEARRWVEAALDPELVPPEVSALLTTSDGRIWLRTAGDLSFEGISVSYQSRLWLVLGPDLSIDRWVRLPEGVRPLDARGDIAWGTVTDDLDVSYLVKLQIGPPE